MFAEDLWEEGEKTKRKTNKQNNKTNLFYKLIYVCKCNYVSMFTL